MNYSEVKELLTAGFTASEIRQILFDNPQEDNPQNTQVNQQEKPEHSIETPENNSEKQLAKTQDPAGSPIHERSTTNENTNDDKYNQLNNTMEKLIRTIQTANFNNNSFDTMKETDINKEVDKIMAGIIRPEREKGGNDQ